MATFRAYPSITNSSAKWMTTPADEENFRKTEWVITEKIHGANFSMIVTPPNEDSADGAFELTCARRTGIIGEKENFFGSKTVSAKYEEHVFLLYNKLKERYPKLTQVSLFAEIYGGRYDHPDVPKIKGPRAVQPQIQYRPDIDIQAFDIGFAENGTFRFMDWDEMVPLMDECEIPRAKELFRGSLTEALEFPILFPSGIPKELGLPPVEGNNCEGVVIRPVKELTVGDGDDLERCLIKKKNAEFEEVANVPKPKKKEYDPISEKIQNVIFEFQARVTENRLDATISKIGDIHDKKNFKPILDFFVGDTTKDTLADAGDGIWADLTGAEQKQVKKEVTKMCREMMVARMKKEDR